MLLAAAAILYYTFMAEFALHLAGATRSGMMLAFTSAAIFILSYTFKKRFPIKQYTIPYLTAMGMNVLIYAINIWGDPVGIHEPDSCFAPMACGSVCYS